MTENELIKNALTRHAPDMSQLTASELLERQRDGARVKSRRSWIGVAAVAAAGLVLTVGLLIYTHRDSRVTPGDDVDSVEDVIPSEADELPPDKGKEWVDLTILSADELEKAEYQCRAEGWPEYVFTINKHTVTAFRYLVSETVPTDSTELTGNGEFLVRKLFLRDLTGDRKPEIIAVLSPEDDPDTTLVRTLDLSTKSITEYNLSGAANISAGMIDGEVKFILEDQETGEISYLDITDMNSSEVYKNSLKQQLRNFLKRLKTDSSASYSVTFCEEPKYYLIPDEHRDIVIDTQLNGWTSGWAEDADSYVIPILDELLSDRIFDNITEINSVSQKEYYRTDNTSSIYFDEHGNYRTNLRFSLDSSELCVFINGDDLRIRYFDRNSNIYTVCDVSGQKYSILNKRSTVFKEGSVYRSISIQKVSDLNCLPEEERCIQSSDGEFKAYYSLRPGSKGSAGYELVFDKVIFPGGEDTGEYQLQYSARFFKGGETTEPTGQMPIRAGTAFEIYDLLDGARINHLNIDIITDRMIASEYLVFNGGAVSFTE